MKPWHPKVLPDEWRKRRIFIHRAFAIGDTQEFIVDLPVAIPNVVFVNYSVSNVANNLLSISELNNSLTETGVPYWRAIWGAYQMNGIPSGLPDQLMTPTTIKRLHLRVLDLDGKVINGTSPWLPEFAVELEFWTRG